MLAAVTAVEMEASFYEIVAMDHHLLLCCFYGAEYDAACCVHVGLVCCIMRPHHPSIQPPSIIHCQLYQAQEEIHTPQLRAIIPIIPTGRPCYTTKQKQ